MLSGCTTLALPRERERERSCPAVFRLPFRRPPRQPENAVSSPAGRIPESDSRLPNGKRQPERLLCFPCPTSDTSIRPTAETPKGSLKPLIPPRILLPPLRPKRGGGLGWGGSSQNCFRSVTCKHCRNGKRPHPSPPPRAGEGMQLPRRFQAASGVIGTQGGNARLREGERGFQAA